MDLLGAYDSFVRAVNTGSLSGAARLMHISQPAVSQQISALEKLLGTRLLHRDREGVRMTVAGKTVYTHAQTIITEQKNILAKLEQLTGNADGQLKVTASLGLSQHLMTDVIVHLAKLHPELKILLQADDRVLNLDEEDIDIALRFGQLGGGNGVARKFATLDMWHVATPSYLDSTIRPSHPEQLAELDFLQYRPSDEQTKTTLSNGTKTIQVPMSIGLTAQLPDLIFQALYANLGFSQAPRFFVEDAVKKGQLEIILPKWKIPQTALYLVFPEQSTFSPRIITFLKALFDRLDKTKGATLLQSARRMLK